MKRFGEKKESYRRKQPERAYKIFLSFFLFLPKPYFSKVPKMENFQQEFKWFHNNRKRVSISTTGVALL